MWRRYFKFKLVPGVVITQKFGRIDFRGDSLSEEMLLQLYEDDFPYLELTDEGKDRFYGIKKQEEPPPPVKTPKKRKSTRFV